MANEYYVGEQVRVTGTFTDIDGDAQDPGTVTITTKDPSGNETALVYGVDAEVIKSATGVYYTDITTDEDGVWHYKYVGTVSGISAGEGWFIVKTSF